MKFDTKSIIKYMTTGKLEPTKESFWEVIKYPNTSFRFWCKNNHPNSTEFTKSQKDRIKARLLSMSMVPSNYEHDWIKIR